MRATDSGVRSLQLLQYQVLSLKARQEVHEEWEPCEKGLEHLTYMRTEGLYSLVSWKRWNVINSYEFMSDASTCIIRSVRN